MINKIPTLLGFVSASVLVCLVSIKVKDDFSTFFFLGIISILFFYLFYVRKKKRILEYRIEMIIFLYIYIIYSLSLFIYVEAVFMGYLVPKTQEYFLFMSVLYKFLTRVFFILLTANLYSIFAIRKLLNLKLLSWENLMFLILSLFCSFSTVLLYSVFYMFLEISSGDLGKFPVSGSSEAGKEVAKVMALMVDSSKVDGKGSETPPKPINYLQKYIGAKSCKRQCLL
jgi:hypothetical protein